MRVVAFTGMPGAGKSEAVQVARERTLPIVSMGDEVRAEARAAGLSPTDENLGRLATSRRDENGPDYWARKTVHTIRKQHPKAALVVIDGVRTLAEVDAFRAELGAHFHLVAIVAPASVRAGRMMARKRSDDAANAADLALRDEREKAWGIEQAIAAADTTIRNDPPLAEFRAQVARALERLIGAA